MRKTKLSPLLWSLIALLISACTTLQQPSRDNASTGTSSLEANRQIEQWQLSGKVGLRNGNQAHSAYLNWRQCGSAYDIRLTGPFGQGAAHLTGDDNYANLQTSDKQSFSASNPEQLLAQHFGWSLPINELLYWIRGVPSPQNDFQANNDLHGFSQQQWDVSYPKMTAVNQFQLPAKAVAERAPFKVTVLIKNWQLSPNCSATQ